MLNDQLKLGLAEAKEKGIESWTQIAIRFGVSKSTVTDFLSGRTHKVWWDNYKGSSDQCKYGGPKILIYDIENSPEISYTWGRWKQNVGETQVIQRPYMLTWAAKWLHEDTIYADKLTNYKKTFAKDVSNDFEIVRSLWEMIDEADIIVAHNNDKHDEPFFNTRAMVHGFTPPAPYKRIDTLKEVKRAFKFPSNSLKSLMNHLELTRKLDNEGFELWAKCVNGVVQAFEEMEEYNVGDIASLEALYLKIRPWIRNHPNVTLYGDNGERGCAACGSTDLEYLPEKFAYTGVSVFPVHRCNCCGKVNRGRTSIKTPAQRKNILTNAL